MQLPRHCTATLTNDMPLVEDWTRDWNGPTRVYPSGFDFLDSRPFTPFQHYAHTYTYTCTLLHMHPYPHPFVL